MSTRSSVAASVPAMVMVLGAGPPTRRCVIGKRRALGGSEQQMPVQVEHGSERQHEVQLTRGHPADQRPVRRRRPGARRPRARRPRRRRRRARSRRRCHRPARCSGGEYSVAATAGPFTMSHGAPTGASTPTRYCRSRPIRAWLTRLLSATAASSRTSVRVEAVEPVDPAVHRSRDSVLDRECGQTVERTRAARVPRRPHRRRWRRRAGC